MSSMKTDDKCIPNKDLVSKIYDTNMLCTYQIEFSKPFSFDEDKIENVKDEEKDDSNWKNILYNVQLSQVFLAEDDTCVSSSYILGKIEKLYELVKDVQFIIDIISANKHSEIFSENTQEEKDFLLFQTLFSYDYFHLFHKCMIYYYSSISSKQQLEKCIKELSNELQCSKNKDETGVPNF